MHVKGKVGLYFFFNLCVCLLTTIEDISGSCFVEINNSLESSSSLSLCFHITLHIGFLV